MTVFVDTSALLPLLDESDDDHGAVVAALQELAHQQEQLITSSYTMVEAAALVKRRLGAIAFKRLGEVAGRAMRIIWVDEELHERAWERAADQGRDGPSLVDCTSFLVMCDNGVTRALALDDHFRGEGFQTVP